MHSLSPGLWLGHRKNTTAMSAITATALTTLTGPYSGRGRSYYGNNYNPGNNYYIVNDHHEKGRPPKHKKDNKDKKHKKHHDDD